MRLSASPRRRLARGVLAVLAAAGIVVPLLTIRRVPTPFPDAELYASIALARHLYGIGVPTLTLNSPAAVDHIPFYGPVFFDLAAFALRLVGIGVASVRLASALGAMLYAIGAMRLTWQFTRSLDRTLLAAALTLLTPEVNFGFTSGTMHMLAIGFEVLALDAFVRRLEVRSGAVPHGLAAGVWLTLAALTTPRTYPFIFAFLCAGFVAAIFGSARASVRDRLAASMVVLLGGVSLWATVSHRGVVAWGRYMSFIFTHEDTDVAILPTAVRELSFHWSGLLIPAAALALGTVAVWSIRRHRDGAAAGEIEARTGALSFVLTCAWIQLIASAVVLNYTFSTGEYLVLPLFAVVVAWPWESAPLPRRGVAAVAGLLLCLQVVFLSYRYACLTITWRARDPDPLSRFIARQVPAGSAVAGPVAPFLFAVESNGSRYRSFEVRSWADWARWVPVVEPRATSVANAFRPATPPAARFFLWPAEEPLPPAYRCASESMVARYEAADVDRRWPAWLVRVAAERYPGYPASTLYRLPSGCPRGYDPLQPNLPTSVLRPPSSVLRPPTSNLQPPTSNLQPPTSNLQPPTSNLQPLTPLDLRRYAETRWTPPHRQPPASPSTPTPRATGTGS